MLRNPFFTLINVLGLSVGFAVFLCCGKYSDSELNSDRQWKDWDRIVMLGFKWEWTDDGKTGDSRLFRSTVTALAAEIGDRLSRNREYTRTIHQVNFNPDYAGFTDRLIVHVENRDGSKNYFKEENMVCADANLFTFFPSRLRRAIRKNFCCRPMPLFSVNPRPKNYSDKWVQWENDFYK